MSRMKKKTRRIVKIKMKNIIKGYMKCSSILSEHLAITSSYESTLDEECDIDNIIDNIDKNIDSICDVNESVECEEDLVDEEMSSEPSSEDSDDEDAFDKITENEDENIDVIYGSIECKEGPVVEKESVNEMSNENSEEEDIEENRIVKEDGLNFVTVEDFNTTYYNFRSWILEYARKGKIQSCVIDIISLRQHFFIPQVEDFSLPSVHLISLKILSAIIGLLLGTTKPYVTYLTRDGSYLNRYTIEPITETSGLKFSPCQNIMETDESIRKSVLLDITETTLDLRDIPDEWHLFLIAVVFWLKNMNQPAATECHLHTLVMCIVCIYTIDSHVGVHRNKQTFTRKYKKYLSKIVEERSGTKDTLKKSGTLTFERIENSNPKNEFDNVTCKDCVFIFESVLPYHHLSEQIKTKPKTFCLTTVHAFSQFQSCLYHLIILNSVLGFPFKETVVSHLFSGTFAYNMFTNLSKRNNVNVYTSVFFQSCPSLLKLYKVLVHIIESALSGTNLCRSTLKKQRKKKRQSKQSKTEYVIDNNTEEVEELFTDENNRFSSLLLYT